MWSYVAIFIAFLLIAKFVLPALRAKATASKIAESITRTQMASWERLAQRLGLKFTELPKSKDRKVYQSGGVDLKGTYKGRLLHVHYYHETKEYAEGMKYGYAWKIDAFITVENGKPEMWVIEPRNPNKVMPKIGIPSFDEVLTYEGERVYLSREALEKLAQYGWMSLIQKNGVLTFKDDFIEYTHKSDSSTSIAGATHPVWGISSTQYNLDVDRGANFIDFLVNLY